MKTKTQFLTRWFASLNFVALLLAFGSTAHAASTYYWDFGGTPTTTWVTTANWATTAGGTANNADTAGPPVAGDTAIFNVTALTTAQTVTFDANPAAASLVFNNAGGTAFSGTAQRVFSLSGGMTIGASSGAVTLGGAANAARITYTLGASQSWVNNSANTATLSFNSGPVNNSIALGVNTLTFDGVLGGDFSFNTQITVTGTGGIIKNGANTVTMGSTSSSFTGPLTLNAGTFAASIFANVNTISSIGQGSATSQASDIVFGGGTLKHSAANVASTDRLFTIGNASGNTATLDSSGALVANGLAFTGTGSIAFGNTSAHTLTLTGSNTGTANTFAPIIGDNTGLTSLVKSGAGAWTLSGVNTYSGATVVNAGTLLVNSPGSLASGSAVTVASGALLGGSGTINGTVSAAANGNLAPGGLNTIGTLTLANGGTTALTLNGNSLLFDVTAATTAGTTYDQMAITGTGQLVLNGASTISLYFPGGTAAVGTYTLMTFAQKTGSGTLALDHNYPNASLAIVTGDGTANSGSVTLTVSGSPAYTSGDVWKGTASAVWNTSALNWTKNGTASSAYGAGDAVTFDDSASGNFATISGTVSPASVTFNNSINDYTISAAIQNTATASLVKNGTATATLSGVNTYSGGTTVSAGTLALSGSGTLGNTAGALTVSGGTLDLGALTTPAVGTVTISGGTIQNGTLTGTSYAGQSGTVSAILAGSGIALTKTTSGLLTLSGANTYSGATAVNAGTLLVNSPGSLSGSGVTVNGGTLLVNGSLNAGSTVTVASGATLGGSGTISGTVSGSAGGILAPGGVNAIGKLALGSTLTLAGNTLKFDLNVTTTAGTTYDQIAVASTLTMSGANIIRLNSPGGSIATGNYTLMTFATSTASTFTFPNGSTSMTIGGSTLTLNNGTTSLTLGVSGAAASLQDLTWNGNLSGVWDGGTLNWTNGAAAAAFSDGNAVTFDDSGVATATITSGGTVSPGYVIFNNSTKNYTVSATIGGTGTTLTKSGTGTSTLTGPNAYTGVTTVNAGVLNVQHATALGATTAGTTVTGAGAALQLQGGIAIGAEPLQLTGQGVASDGALRNISGDNSFAGAISLATSARISADSGTLTLNGGILKFSGNPVLTLAGAGSIILGGNIASLGTGGITINSSGAVTLSGANTIGSGSSAAVILTAGTLNVNNSTALGSGTIPFTITSGTLNNTSSGDITLVNNNPITINGDFAFTGTKDLNLNAGAVTLGTTAGTARSITANAGTLTIGGAIANGTTAFGLTKAGNGTLALGGANTYSGDTTISAGTLTINGSGSLGSGSYAANIPNSGTFSYNSSAAQTISGTISGAGSLIQGAGTLTLSGANSYSGATTISAGTLKLGAAGSGANGPLGTTAGDTTVSATGAALDLNGFSLATAEPLTLNGTGISGGGALTNSSATVATYSGLITLGSDSKIGGNGNIILSAVGTITGSGFGLTLDGSATGSSLASIIGTGAGTLTKAGTGTWTLSGANTYTGGTTVSAGTLALSGSGTLGNTAGALTVSGGTLDLGALTTPAVGTVTISGGTIQNGTLTGTSYAGQSGTVSAVLAGSSVALTKTTAGTLTLSGANTYSGATAVSAGTLLVNSPGATAAGSAVTVAGGATLGGNGTISGAVTVNAGGVLVPGGVNTINTLNLANSGATALTLNGGTIFSDLPNGVTTADRVAVTGTLVLNGPNTIILNAPNGAVLAGTYTLMTYGAKTGTGTLTFANGTTSMGNATLNVPAGAGAGSVTVVVGAGGLTGQDVWKGNVSGAWDTTTANWTKNGTASSLFVAGDAVMFDDTATAFSVSGTVQLPSSVVVNNNANNYAVSAVIGGPTSGSGLRKLGAGNLTLSGVNTYTNDTRIGAGTITLGAATTIAKSVVDLNAADSGTLSFGTLTAATFAGLSGSRDLNLQNTESAAVTLSLLGGTALKDTVYSGVLSGSGGLIKDGNWMLTLSGNNTFTGDIYMNTAGADLSVGSDASLGTGSKNITINQNCNFRTTGNVTTSKNYRFGAGTGAGSVNMQLFVSSGTTFTINSGIGSVSGAVAGASEVTKKNTGTLELTAATTGWATSGSTFVLTAGTFNWGHNLALDGIATLIVNGNSTFDNTWTGGAFTSTAGLSVITAGTAVTFTGTHDLTLSGASSLKGDNHTITVMAGNLTLSGGVTNDGVARILTKAGAGTLTLSGVASTYGNTAVTSGELHVGMNNSLPTGGTLTLGNTATPATVCSLDLGGFNQQLVSLAVASSATASAQIIGNDSTTSDSVLTLTGDTAFSGTIQDQDKNSSGSRKVGLTFNDGGSTPKTLTLAGANTYTGPTTLTSGTLRVNGSLGATAVAVNGTSILGGNGSIGGSVTMAATGTTLAPGIAGTTPGTLAISGALTLNANNLNYDIVTTSSMDKITVGGALTSSGAASTLNIAGNPTLAVGDYTLIEVTGSLNGSASDITLAPGMPGDKLYTIVYDTGSTPKKVVLNVAPNNSALKWVGTGGNGAKWNSDTTTGMENWQDLSAVPFFYADLAAVTFDSVGNAHLTVDITETVSPASTTVTSDSYTFTGIGKISGTGGLNKSGTGTLTIGTTNDFTGDISLAAGTVNLNAAETGSTGPLGKTGQIIFSGGTLQYSGANNADYSDRFKPTGAQPIKVDTAGRDVSFATALPAAASLTKSGTGKLTLATASTISGAVTLSAGTLDLGAANSSVGAVSVTAAAASGETITNGSLTGTSYAVSAAAGNAIISANLLASGAAGVAKSGAGTLTLSGANTYSGGTALSAGQLNINSATALGATAGALTISGTTPTIDNTSAAALTLVNNNAQEWFADFTFAGNNNLNMGTGGVTLNANRTVTISDGNLTVGGIITSAGSAYDLTKVGPGTLTLNGLNTYHGQTKITAGAVSINTIANQDAACSLGSATTTALAVIAIGSGGNTGTLIYTGTGHSSTRPLDLAGTTGGATIQADGSGALTFSGDNKASGSGSKTLTLQGSSTAANTISGDITNNSTAGGKLTSVIKSGNGTWVLSGAKTFTGGLTLNAGVLKTSGNSADALGLGTLGLTGGELILAGSAAMNYARNTTVSGPVTITSDSSSATIRSYTFGTLAIGSQSLTNNAGPTVSASSGNPAVTFDTTTISGNAVFTVNNGSTAVTKLSLGALAGTGGSLTKNGAGMLNLSFNATTFNGNSTINAGQVRFGGGTALGTAGSLAWNGGTISSDGVTARTIPNNTTLGGDVTLGTATESGAITLSGTVNLGAATRQITVANAADTISGQISNGGLTKAGAGTLTLSSANTFSGGLTLSAGTILVGDNNALGANANAVTINGGTLASANLNGLTIYTNLQPITVGGDFTLGQASGGIGSLVLSGPMNLGGTLRTITVANNASPLLFCAIQGKLSGTGGFTKSGSGSLVLAGPNDFTGQVTVNAGNLVVLTNTALGTPANSVVVNSGGRLALGQSAYVTSLNFTNPLSIAGTGPSGTTALVASGASGSTATYSGLITLTGATTIGADAGNTLSLDVASGNTIEGAFNLTFTGAGNHTVNDPIVIGAGSLTKTGTGALTLSAANTYSGATLVSAGKLVGVTGGACANSAVTVTALATNGVSLAAANGQWACGGLTYNSGTTYADFDCSSFVPSTTTAPLQINGNFAANGTVNVRIRNGTAWATGTYPLFTWTGTGPANLAGFGTPLLPAGVQGALSLSTETKTISLVVGLMVPDLAYTNAPGLARIITLTDIQAAGLQSSLGSPTYTITGVGTASAGGTITRNNGNTLMKYTYPSGSPASDSFTYTVSDGTLSATATVTITFASVAGPPLTPTLDGSHHPVISFHGLPGYSYHIQRASTLSPTPDWADVHPVTLDGNGDGSASWTDTSKTVPPDDVYYRLSYP